MGKKVEIGDNLGCVLIILIIMIGMVLLVYVGK